MRENYKRIFVEEIDDGRKFIVYPISPIKGVITDFREEQFKKVPRGERFYKAEVIGSGLRTIEKNGVLIPFSNGACIKDDVVKATVIGYRPPKDREVYFQTRGYDPSDVHRLLHVKTPSEDDLRAIKDHYFNANDEEHVLEQPFRISFPKGFNRKQKNFVFFEPYSSSVNNSMNIMTINGIAQITDMAYFEQLLIRNKVELLRKRTSDDDLNQIFSLYSFGIPITIDLSDVSNEEKVKVASTLLHGEENASKESGQSILDSYNEQARIDLGVIECVKQYILKRD